MMEKRKSRRAATAVRGTAQLDGTEIRFRTHNISTGGSLIQLEHGSGLRVGAKVQLRLTDLGFGARATVRWLSALEGSQWLAGVRFDQMDYGHSLNAVSG